MLRTFIVSMTVLAALASCGSDEDEILLACNYRDSLGECSETIRGSGTGSFEGDCTTEVEACPTDGIVATCSEDEDFAYEVIYYYANADLVDAQETCEFFDGIWEQL
jgi:hypothetical protein